MHEKCIDVLHAFSSTPKKKANECFKILSLLRCPARPVAIAVFYTRVKKASSHCGIYSKNSSL